MADALDSGSSDSNILWVQVPSSAPKNKASQRRCLVFLYDEDLNPPKKGTPQSRRLCGEEEQLRSGRPFSAQRNKAKAQHAATKVPSSAPKNKASQRRCLVFLYDEDLNPPKKGTPQSRRLCGEEEQLRSGRHFPRSGTRRKRSVLRRKSHHPHHQKTA